MKKDRTVARSCILSVALVPLFWLLLIIAWFFLEKIPSFIDFEKSAFGNAFLVPGIFALALAISYFAPEVFSKATNLLRKAR